MSSATKQDETTKQSAEGSQIQESIERGLIPKLPGKSFRQRLRKYNGGRDKLLDGEEQKKIKITNKYAKYSNLYTYRMTHKTSCWNRYRIGYGGRFAGRWRKRKKKKRRKQK